MERKENTRDEHVEHLSLRQQARAKLRLRNEEMVYQKQSSGGSEMKTWNGTDRQIYCCSRLLMNLSAWSHKCKRAVTEHTTNSTIKR